MRDLQLFNGYTFSWFYEGETPCPLCTAYCFIFNLSTEYGLILVLRTAYRLTTKTIFIGISIYTKKIRSTVCGMNILILAKF